MKYLAPFVILSILVFACKHQIPTPEEPDPKNHTVSDSCSSDTVYFVNDILPLLRSTCARSGCHDQNTAQDGIMLLDYETITDGENIIPGDADESDIFDVISETDPDKIMPPPPNPALSQSSINAIRTWINQGAKIGLAK